MALSKKKFQLPFHKLLLYFALISRALALILPICKKSRVHSPLTTNNLCANWHVSVCIRFGSRGPWVWVSRIHTYIPLTLYPRRGSRDISDSAPRRPRFTKITLLWGIPDVTGGKPIAVWSQSISGVSAVNPLVAFYDIRGRQREVVFFYFVSDTTRGVEKKNVTVP
jgi:hypothetical protein